MQVVWFAVEYHAALVPALVAVILVMQVRTLLWILAETGMRAGEVTGLRASDVNLANLAIDVNQSMWHGIADVPKTRAGRRSICISSVLAAHLGEYLAGRTEGYLFQTSAGKPWDTANVLERMLNPLLKRVGIPKLDEDLLTKIVGDGRTVAQATVSEKRAASVGLHSFRHTNKTAMDSLHIPEGVQSKRLGHSKGDVPGRYRHAFTPDEHDAAEKLGNLFGKDWPEPEPGN
jgi:integrase